MSKIIVAAVTAVVLAGGTLLASRAEAMTLAAPAGARAAIDQSSTVEKARYVCYRTWRHGHRQRVCTWRPSYPYYGYQPSPYYYGGYPYYRSPYAYHRRPGVGFYFRF